MDRLLPQPIPHPPRADLVERMHAEIQTASVVGAAVSDPSAVGWSVIAIAASLIAALLAFGGSAILQSSRSHAEGSSKTRSRRSTVAPAVELNSPTETAKFLVPYLRNPVFVGRSGALDKLKSQLHKQHGIFAKFLASQSRACLYGVGGVGKTQLALEHVYWLERSSPEVSVFWVDASSAETFEASYASIAEHCGVPGPTPETDNQLMIVKEWLETSKFRWLMVIDGVADTKLSSATKSEDKIWDLAAAEFRQARQLADYIPKCSHGSILITTRNAQIGSQLVREESLIEVDKLTNEEAHLLIKTSMASKVTLEDAAVLSSEVRNLPLALEQAAAFIREASISISDYIQLLNQSDGTLVDRLTEADGTDSEVPRGVAAAWFISFECLERQHGQASELLYFLSLFHSQSIPQAFPTNPHMHESKLTNFATNHEYAGGLDTLKTFCFVSERKDKSIDIHPFTQLLTRKWLIEKGKMAAITECVLEMLGNVDISDEPLRYIPHFATLLGNIRWSLVEAFQRLGQASLLHTMAHGLDGQGRLSLQTAYFSQLVDLESRRYGGCPPSLLPSLERLVSKYIEQKRWDAAARVLFETFVMSERLPRKGVPFVCTSIDELRRLCKMGGRYSWGASLNLPSTLPRLVDSIFDWIPFLSSEPPIPEGQVRMRWTCSCGQNLFDDFAVSNFGFYDFLLLEACLQLPQFIQRNDPTTSSSRAHSQFSWRWPILMLKALGQTLGGSRVKRNQERSPLPTHHVNTRVLQATSGPDPYLLMCIDRDRHFTGLHQEKLVDTKDDSQLVEFMRQKFSEHRGIGPWLTFRSVKAVSLARFGVDNSLYAQVHHHKEACGQGCVCIPPVERVRSREYHCSPAPERITEHAPALGTNYLTHYFMKPHAFQSPQRYILNQVPKRAQGPLCTSQASIELGWGIHIQEGWHWRTIYFVVVVVFVIGGFVFGITWSIKGKDIQSAFAIAASWMALGPLLLGYIAVRDME